MALPQIGIRNVMTDALQYWEPRRIAYNFVLALVAMGCLIKEWRHGMIELTLDLAVSLALYAILANLVFCAAYAAEALLAIVSGKRTTWLHWRTVGFYGGLLLAVVFTWRICARISEDLL